MEVAGPLGSTILLVVDDCGGCGTNGLDIANDSFVLLETMSAGQYQSCWTEIECPPSVVSGNIQYLFPERNYYFFSIYIRNFKVPVSTLEIEVSSNWTNIPRQNSNKFALTVAFTAPFKIRLTSTDGQQIIDTIEDSNYTTNNIFISSGQFGPWQGITGSCNCSATYNSSQVCSGQVTPPPPSSGGSPTPTTTTGSNSPRTTGNGTVASGRSLLVYFALALLTHYLLQFL